MGDDKTLLTDKNSYLRLITQFYQINLILIFLKENQNCKICNFNEFYAFEKIIYEKLLFYLNITCHFRNYLTAFFTKFYQMTKMRFQKQLSQKLPPISCRVTQEYQA